MHNQRWGANGVIIEDQNIVFYASNYDPVSGKPGDYQYIITDNLTGDVTTQTAHGVVYDARGNIVDFGPLDVVTVRGGVEFRVESAGMNDGNYARIYKNGELIDMEYGRGFNIAVIDKDGNILWTGSYDTYGSQDAANQMANDLNTRIPEGAYVLIAVLDSAEAN